MYRTKYLTRVIKVVQSLFQLQNFHKGVGIPSDFPVMTNLCFSKKDCLD